MSYKIPDSSQLVLKMLNDLQNRGWKLAETLKTCSYIALSLLN